MADPVPQTVAAAEGVAREVVLVDGSTNYNVRVAVRIRPLLPKEVSERCRECVQVDYAGQQVIIGKTIFTYDRVFGSEVTQEHVYEETCLPLIEGLGAGLNAALLAYGQTSSGKTFTLGSCSHTAVLEEKQGIIPRFVNALFRDLIYARRALADIQVRVSFVELHNEDINDLLDPNFLVREKGNVTIREDPSQGVVVVGMKEVDVSKPSELMRCLEKGAVFRTTATTLMNDQSSRSHAIFTVTVEQYIHATGDTLTAKIRFCDLAGSERAKKTGTVGERFREGVNINQGLLALGNVISALGDPKLNKQHVPYRDSKLTRLLQDSLGGNSRTLMIACVAPADVHFGETLNTLKYANRAKNIENRVLANVSVTDPEVAQLREQIRDLQLALLNSRQQPQPQLQPPPQSQPGPVFEPVFEDDSFARLQRGHVAEVQSSFETLQCNYEKIEQENHQLRIKVVSLELSLHEAKQDCAKHEKCIESPDRGQGKQMGQEDNGARESEGSLEEELARNMRTIRELRVRNMRLEQLLEQAPLQDASDEWEPVAEPPSENDVAHLLQSPIDSLDDSFAGETGQSEMGDEALAHVEEDVREEERHVCSQREMDSTVFELDEVIKEKEVLVDQLTKQGAVFQSMKARYEMRLNELKTEVEHITEEKEGMLKEMRQLMTATQTSARCQRGGVQDEKARRAAEEASKRKAVLEGRLKEVNRQLGELRRRQVEAQRLLRLKEQQANQIQRMREEIARLKGQKQVVVSRMKFEEQQHRLWRKRWTTRNNQLSKDNVDLQNKRKRQDKLLQMKTAEVARSHSKIEELRREQHHHLAASQMRLQVDRDIARAMRLREANERLQRELEERELRVRQMEAMLSERERLQSLQHLNSEGKIELREVEETIETLDAQIEFDSECIAQSQTDILRLTSTSGGQVRSQGQKALVEEEEGLPRFGGETTGASCTPEAIVARLGNLEEARVTCLACLQSIGDLRTDNGRLQGRLAELEEEATQRCTQLDELQARERLAETKWAEQANAMQRLHLDKEVYLLSRVDRNLTHEHGLERPASPEDPCEQRGGAGGLPFAAGVIQLFESPTMSQLHAAEEPVGGVETGSMTREALLNLLQCRTDQNDLLTQQAEHLHRSLERAERASSEAEMNVTLARWEVDKVRAEAEERCALSGGIEAPYPPQTSLSLAGVPALAPVEARERRPRAAPAPPSPEVQAEDSEGSASEDLGTAEVVRALRLFVENSAEECADFKMLEGTVEIASDELRSLWLDLGMDTESQQRHLRRLANDMVRLCGRELRRHSGTRSQLQQHHGDLRAMAATHALQVQEHGGSACSAGSVAAREMPLHQKHALLKADICRGLESCVGRLQRALQELFGLPIGPIANEDNAVTVSAQLKLLEGTGLLCLPGRGDATSLLQQQDWDILGISEDSARQWLKQPVDGTFLALNERQMQVEALLAEMLSHFRKVDAELRGHFAVMGTPVQQQEEFFASRGTGLPALASAQRELLRLQHSARLRVAEGRVRMAEQWMELGSSGSEQEAVLQRLRTCAERDALSELRALGEETGRLEAKIEGRREILHKFEVCSGLDQEIQEFEREACDSYRLRGSSSKLLQEEQDRRKFRKRREKGLEELITKLVQWEQTHSESFLHKGLPMMDTLQQELETLRGLAAQPPAAQRLQKVASQTFSETAASHSTSLRSVRSASGLSGGQPIVSGAGGSSSSSSFHSNLSPRGSTGSLRAVAPGNLGQGMASPRSRPASTGSLRMASGNPIANVTVPGSLTPRSARRFPDQPTSQMLASVPEQRRYPVSKRP